MEPSSKNAMWNTWEDMEDGDLSTTNFHRRGASLPSNLFTDDPPVPRPRLGQRAKTNTLENTELEALLISAASLNVLTPRNKSSSPLMTIMPQQQQQQQQSVIMSSPTRENPIHRRVESVPAYVSDDVFANGSIDMMPTHRRVGSNPAALLSVTGDEKFGPSLLGEVPTHRRIGSNSSSSISASTLDGLLSALPPPVSPDVMKHRRIGSNPANIMLDGEKTNGVHTPQQNHRRSVTFDPSDFTYVLSNNDSTPPSTPPMPHAQSSPVKPIVNQTSPITITNTSPSILSANNNNNNNNNNNTITDPNLLQAQLQAQQQVILQQQQWMMAVQQQNYYKSSPQRQRVGLTSPNSPSQLVADQLLLEYKNNGVRPTVEDLLSNTSVMAFALDSAGSRFLQYQMEISTPREKEQLVFATLDNFLPLMLDAYGNYVAQNFLTHGNQALRKAMALKMKGYMLSLSINTHGCRVVQRMLDVVDLDMRNELLEELILGSRHNILQAAMNTQGTHVLQKTVSMLRRDVQNGGIAAASSRELLGSIEKQISLDVIQLLLHPNSYRFVLNVLGDCSRINRPFVGQALDAICFNQEELSKDQHGNFILQQLLEVPSESKAVFDFVFEHLFELSRHKFASHLVEKCFQVGSNQICIQYVEEFLRPQHNSTKLTVVDLMMDPYANFVIQKAFDRLNAIQGSTTSQLLKNEVVQLVQSRADLLGRFTYGRHILGHVISQQQQQQQSTMYVANVNAPSLFRSPTRNGGGYQHPAYPPANNILVGNGNGGGGNHYPARNNPSYRSGNPNQ